MSVRLVIGVVVCKLWWFQGGVGLVLEWNLLLSYFGRLSDGRAEGRQEGRQAASRDG